VPKEKKGRLPPASMGEKRGRKGRKEKGFPLQHPLFHSNWGRRGERKEKKKKKKDPQKRTRLLFHR